MTRRGLFRAMVGAAAAPKVASEPRVSIYGKRYLSAAWTGADGLWHNAQFDLKYYARAEWAQLEAGIKTEAQVMRALLDGRCKPLDAAG